MYIGLNKLNSESAVHTCMYVHQSTSMHIKLALFSDFRCIIETLKGS